MNINTYQEFTRTTWQKSVHSALDKGHALTGLVAEVGEVMAIFQKQIRDDNANGLDRDKLVKELGDVAYYWARVCDEFDIKASEVLEVNVDKLTSRFQRGKIGGSGDER